MKYGHVRLFLLTLLVAMTAAVAARGEDQKKPAASRKAADAPKPVAPSPDAPKPVAPSPAIQLSPDSATVDGILNQAVKNIAARYNLNEAQSAKTAEIMRREVYKFLKTHEEKVWPVIRDLIQAQLGNTPPNDSDMAKRIGKAAGEMMGEVEEAILRGNEEWRMYLTPDQKRMHDYDLAEMDRTFKQLEGNFESWAKGDPNQGPLFPPPPPPELSPSRPKQPSQGLPEPEIEIFRPTLFETFVEEFIRKYKLDKSQIETARSILAEFQAKANDFKNSKKDELKQIALAMRTAHEKADRKGLQDAEVERKKLLEPVHELFGEMNNRLMALLTTAQVQQFAAADANGDRTNSVAATRDEKPDAASTQPRTDGPKTTTKPAQAPQEKKDNS